jgi:hypothetical protein
MAQVDTFTTFARLAGVPLPTDRAIDGIDQSNFCFPTGPTSRQRDVS